MVLQYHKADYGKLVNEDETRAAIRKGAPAPGMYMFPNCSDHKQMASPEMLKKFEEGPIGILYIRPSGSIKLGPFLIKWILYTAAVSAVVAYIARSVLHNGNTYLEVFRVVGATAWLAYAWQGPSDSIWKGKPWIATAREMFDGLVYASITAGLFAWLWPR